jgi:molybdopterin converting factor small subunit
MTLPSGSTLTEVLLALDINFPLDNLLIVVNGRLAEPSMLLYDGDEIHLIPALSGGLAQII